MTRRSWTDFLVFWKDLIALPDMSSTDVSSCHFSSLSEKNNPSARDKEETWQGERSVKFILGSAIRPFQNTKKLCLTPSSRRDTACRSSKIAIFADGFSALNHFQKSMTVFLRAEMLDRLQFFFSEIQNKIPYLAIGFISIRNEQRRRQAIGKNTVNGFSIFI